MGRKKKKKILFFLATKFGWLIILLLGKLSFIKIVGRHHLENLKKKNVPFIFVLWHGRILLPTYIHRRQGITGMASLNTDGEIGVQIVHKLGYQSVRGSSTRGGKKAFHDMVDVLNRGGTGTMFPDGPRGPRHYLKPGTLYIARFRLLIGSRRNPAGSKKPRPKPTLASTNTISKSRCSRLC